MRICLQPNNAEYCIFNMILSSQIYRRLDFCINILDELDERMSVQKLKLARRLG